MNEAAATLIEELGASNESLRSELSTLAPTINTIRRELGKADEAHEQAVALKNAALLEWLQINSKEEERKRAVAAQKQTNADKWRELQRLQEQLANVAAQTARHEQEEVQTAGRKRAHAASVDMVMRRLELNEALLAEECGAVVDRLRGADQARADKEQREEEEKRAQRMPVPAPAAVADPEGWLDDDALAAMSDSLLFGSAMGPEGPIGGGAW